MSADFTIVVPTVGRASLDALLHRLAQLGVTERIIVVRDTGRRGPAAARNAGWRAATTEWVVFLDDDVLPAPGWREALLRDLDHPPEVAAVQGRVRVPLPRPDRRTDWEADTARLGESRWITADLAYRRSALAAVGGFDEAFPRAYREDADLAFRVRDTGGGLVVGERVTLHPVRPAGRWVSVTRQRGNADDAYLRRKYGPGWRELLEIPAGRRPRHVVTVALAGVTAGAGGAAAALRPGRARRLLRATAATAAAGWAAMTAEFVTHRIRTAPGERRTPISLTVTSALIPPVAVTHWLRGWFAHRKSPRWPDDQISAGNRWFVVSGEAARVPAAHARSTFAAHLGDDRQPVRRGPLRP